MHCKLQKTININLMREVWAAELVSNGQKKVSSGNSLPPNNKKNIIIAKSSFSTHIQPQQQPPPKTNQPPSPVQSSVQKLQFPGNWSPTESQPASFSIKKATSSFLLLSPLDSNRFSELMRFQLQCYGVTTIFYYQQLQSPPHCSSFSYFTATTLLENSKKKNVKRKVYILNQPSSVTNQYQSANQPPNQQSTDLKKKLQNFKYIAKLNESN